ECGPVPMTSNTRSGDRPPMYVAATPAPRMVTESVMSKSPVRLPFSPVPADSFRNAAGLAGTTMTSAPGVVLALVIGARYDSLPSVGLALWRAAVPRNDMAGTVRSSRRSSRRRPGRVDGPGVGMRRHQKSQLGVTDRFLG